MCDKNVPLKPTALVNFNRIDKTLSNVIGNFWKLIWNKENSAIEQKNKYLLSLANAVGARRFRQATRELIKAYALGVSIEELDELFSLFVWNEGVGTFASEIGPSPLFGAYNLMKQKSAEGKTRSEVLKELIDKFGENNPKVGTIYEDE